MAAVAAAVVCGAAAIALGGRESRDEPVAAGLTIAVAPVTLAPRSTPAAPPTSALPTTTPASTTTTTAALSPLNSLVGDAMTVIPAPAPVDVAPVSLSISDIDVTGVPVRPVGVTPEGELEIPGATEAGWYRLGAAPGQAGATVVAAHISWQGSTGPFLRLAELEPGAFVDLALADGATRRYQVVARAQYGKLALPKEEIWRTTGPETLVLITCGGAFNREIRRYADNIVVTAVPVALNVAASERGRAKARGRCADRHAPIRATKRSQTMRKRMFAAVVAAASCTTILAGTAGPAAAERRSTGPAPTLAEILLSDGNQFDVNPFDYDIVTEAVLLFPDLVAAASNPDAELTVFLPNDWAFRKLVAISRDVAAARAGGVRRRRRPRHSTPSRPCCSTTSSPARRSRSRPPSSPTAPGSRPSKAARSRSTSRDAGGRRSGSIDNDPTPPTPRVIHPEVGGEASNGFAHGIDRCCAARPLISPTLQHHEPGSARCSPERPLPADGSWTVGRCGAAA